MFEMSPDIAWLGVGLNGSYWDVSNTHGSEGGEVMNAKKRPARQVKPSYWKLFTGHSSPSPSPSSSPQSSPTATKPSYVYIPAVKTFTVKPGITTASATHSHSIAGRQYTPATLQRDTQWKLLSQSHEKTGIDSDVAHGHSSPGEQSGHELAAVHDQCQGGQEADIEINHCDSGAFYYDSEDDVPEPMLTVTKEKLQSLLNEEQQAMTRCLRNIEHLQRRISKDQKRLQLELLIKTELLKQSKGTRLLLEHAAELDDQNL